MKKDNDIVTIEVDLKVETKAAYGINIGEEQLVWVPKSQCEYDEDDETLQIPEWLAIEKGLV